MTEEIEITEVKGLSREEIESAVVTGNIKNLTKSFDYLAKITALVGVNHNDLLGVIGFSEDIKYNKEIRAKAEEFQEYSTEEGFIPEEFLKSLPVKLTVEDLENILKEPYPEVDVKMSLFKIGKLIYNEYDRTNDDYGPLAKELFEVVSKLIEIGGKRIPKERIAETDYVYLLEILIRVIAKPRGAMGESFLVGKIVNFLFNSIKKLLPTGSVI